MKKLQINKGGLETRYTIVDDDVYDELNKFNWSSDSKDSYVYRLERINGKQKKVYLHRYLMNPPEGKIVDHINRIKIDNRMENLRLATHSQNAVNSKSRRKFKGVFFHNTMHKWWAYLHVNYTKIPLGYFDTAEEAAREYNRAAKEVFGEYVKLNEVQDEIL